MHYSTTWKYYMYIFILHVCITVIVSISTVGNVKPAPCIRPAISIYYMYILHVCIYTTSMYSYYMYVLP